MQTKECIGHHIDAHFFEVGTSGNADERASSETATIFSLPVLWCSKVSEAVSIMTGICPPHAS
jgi:hypothetical protein